MSYSIFVTETSTSFAPIIRRIDKLFSARHRPRHIKNIRENRGLGLAHGLYLSEDNTLSIPCHWNHKHMTLTKRDIEAVLAKLDITARVWESW